ncbi:GntR family transcriptional regulator [Actinomadura formosensis]|uniref:GntR family transcriptional regulator n=1 Tax=Actinomadura formosensis TaxID=60706 RepID=UPI0008378B4A|nr:GntR family transcriptional regulator [Actinomadura formosensis]
MPNELDSMPRRSRTADDVYERLRADILARKLPAGTRLSVPSLAEELGFSRSPVREAVQRLVQAGLATEEVHRGAVVAAMDVSSVLRLYELREALEGMAARLACERATEQEIAEMGALLQEHSRALHADAHDRHLTLDMEFHARVRAAARNEHLRASLERVQDMVALAMMAADATWHQQALLEHQAIYTAIRQGPPETAEAVARAHISRIRHNLASRHKEADVRSADGSQGRTA